MVGVTTIPLAILAGNGNVGIGTTSPGNTLDVNGTGIHIASGTPSSTTYQLYNVGGALTWNGNTVASGTFVNLQSGTPGTQQTGNLNISGKAMAGSVQAAGASSSTWAGVSSTSIGANSSIYSYGSICAGNGSGSCNSTSSMVLAILRR